MDESSVVSLSIASRPPFSLTLEEPVFKTSVNRSTPPESMLTPPFSCNAVEPCSIRPFGSFSGSSSVSVRLSVWAPKERTLLFRVSVLKDSGVLLEAVTLPFSLKVALLPVSYTHLTLPTNREV